MEQIAQRLFCGSLPKEKWGRLAGMPDGSTVRALPWQIEGNDAVRIQTDHPWLDGPALRVVYRDGEQRTAMYNEFMRLRDDAPDGVGTRIFAHQVKAAREMGISYLVTDAEGSPAGTLNGYYTWARLGFNGEIPQQVREMLPPSLSNVSDILDLMSRVGGPRWWRANGRGFFGTFDLREGSDSLVALHEYTSSRGIVI